MSSLQLFERPNTGERTLLVHVDFVSTDAASLSEFKELARSAGAEILHTITGSRSSPDSKYFVGSGKAKEIQQAVQTHQADLVLFNHELSASQERNLEALLQCRVIDRSGLILDIFAQRARTFEGKLQVELAQLNHLATRLVRGWTHLERQKGGIGLRGPGETQLETDRRLIGLRIKNLKKRLGKVSQQRQLSRSARKKAEVPTISLVGYTNAGKSTLFNRIVNSEVYTADQLFATLDPTLRHLQVSGIGDLVFADTVGFIRELPHDLVAAFRSTLQETREASLLLHIVDVSNDDNQTYITHVNQVLSEIGADSVPQIMVYNKIDMIGREPELTYDDIGQVKSIHLSALAGEGVSLLDDALRVYFHDMVIQGVITLQADEGHFRAKFFEYGQVLSEKTDENGIVTLYIRIDEDRLQRMGIERDRIITDLDAKPGMEVIAGAA